jgi:hypothetical protein
MLAQPSQFLNPNEFKYFMDNLRAHAELTARKNVVNGVKTIMVNEPLRAAMQVARHEAAC